MSPQKSDAGYKSMSDVALEEKTDWKVVIVIFGAGAVASAHIGKLPPALPEIREEFSAGLVMGGWFVSMISAVGFGLGLVAGSVADRIGQRSGLMIAACSPSWTTFRCRILPAKTGLVNI